MGNPARVQYACGDEEETLFWNAAVHGYTLGEMYAMTRKEG